MNTNGDYLDTDVVERLARAGLRQLTVTVYGRNPGHYNADHLRARIDTLVLKRGLTPQPGSSPMDVRASKAPLAIRLFGQDFGVSGYDRGGLVTVGLQRQRLSPCSSPFKEISIGYDGSVVLCCNIHSSSPEHANYGVGRVTPERGILEVFGGEKQASWRLAMLQYTPHVGPCARCTRLECGAVDEGERVRYEQACRELLGAGI